MVKWIDLGIYKRMPMKKRRTRRTNAENLGVGGRLCFGKTGECRVDLPRVVVTGPAERIFEAAEEWVVVLGDR